MPDHFINLNCTNCGGKVEIYQDMERFACGYCGAGQIVQRRGGTVALKAVTEAIQNAQIATDKTAAEPAVARLQRELLELYTKGERLWAAEEGKRIQRRIASVSGLGVGAVSLLVGLVFLTPWAWPEQDVFFGSWLCIVGGVGLLFGYLNYREAQRSAANIKKSSELTALQMRQLENQIAEKRRVAHG
jgi:DNA-directed RNA polymerase subunit RPC12/RpoP